MNINKKWFSAISNNKVNDVKSMIESGFDINTKCNPLEYDCTFKINAFTGLICSIIYLNLDITKLLLDQPNIDVNTQDDLGDTALIKSAKEFYSYEATKILLKDPKIDVNIMNNESKNFIDYIKIPYFLNNYLDQEEIIYNKREDIILFLDKYGAVNSLIKNKYKELFEASKWGLII